MRHLVNITILLLALCLGMTACGDSSCYENGSSLPLASLYVGGKQQTVNRLTVMGIGAPGDSLLAANTSISEIYLPLRVSTDHTSFMLSRQIPVDTVSIALSDTLTIHYTAVPFFHSSECGAMFNFDIKNTECTHHGIDSVVMLTTLVTNSRQPAMRIYFKEVNL